ncbi:MAG TPA: SDR family oxidoreductase [Polyangia bacterium]|nr:SDR family oxidoreductase [Polyangia bacterium]
MSILGRLKSKGPNGLGYATTAEQATADVDLRGRTTLVTGCNSGLGRETTRVLALRGARVIATARTLEKAREACADLAGAGGFVPLACDLSEPASVRACVAAVERQNGPLDVLICNAGIMALPRLTQKLGYELQFLTNHIGHFMLVTGLLNRLTAEGRVVVVASDAHRRAPKAGVELDNLSGERGYTPWKAYGQSKLANILFAKELARRAGDGGRTANALHPGVINTNLNRALPAVARLAMRIGATLVLKDAAQGAATQCYLATSPAVARVTGQYFADCNPAQPEPIANDASLAARLWEASERIVASLP